MIVAGSSGKCRKKVTRINHHKSWNKTNSSSGKPKRPKSEKCTSNFGFMSTPMSTAFVSLPVSLSPLPSPRLHHSSSFSRPSSHRAPAAALALLPLASRRFPRRTARRFFNLFGPEEVVDPEDPGRVGVCKEYQSMPGEE